MNSIRKKLFIQIGGLVLVFITLLLLANSFLFEPYYINKEKEELIDTFEEINGLTDYSSSESLEILADINKMTGIEFLVTEKNEIIFSSFNTNQDRKSLEVFGYLLGYSGNTGPNSLVNITDTEQINSDMKYVWASDPEEQESDLFLLATLDNGNTISLRVSIESITTNVSVVNEFILIIGCFVFIISLIVAYIISTSFTNPIKKMNEQARKIRNLDFSEICEVKSKDEIGELSKNINKMAFTIESNIKDLKTEIDDKARIDEKRQALLNNVSHELKTPLSLMQGYAEGLKININKDNKKKDYYCNVILEETNKMNTLVESLLDIQSMESGEESLSKTNFEVNKFVKDTVDKYSKMFEDNEIELKVNTIRKTTVNGDLFMLERVLTNYITNAINYVDDKKKVKIKVKDTEESIRVEVFNTTSEVSDDDISKIWDSFYKADKARSRDKGGHGLGLSIVKAIMEAHDNKYGLEKKKDGIVFYFEVSYSK